MCRFPILVSPVFSRLLGFDKVTGLDLIACHWTNCFQSSTFPNFMGCGPIFYTGLCENAEILTFSEKHINIVVDCVSNPLHLFAKKLCFSLCDQMPDVLVWFLFNLLCFINPPEHVFLFKGERNAVDTDTVSGAGERNGCPLFPFTGYLGRARIPC